MTQAEMGRTTRWAGSEGRENRTGGGPAREGTEGTWQFLPKKLGRCGCHQLSDKGAGENV